jgi:hypothetical protein
MLTGSICIVSDSTTTFFYVFGTPFLTPESDSSTRRNLKGRDLLYVIEFLFEKAVGFFELTFLK